MGNKKQIGFINSITDKDDTLEAKLLQFYISAELIWAFANAAAGFLIKMPIANIIVYAGLCVGLIVFFFIAHISKCEVVFREIYFVLVYLTIPVLWYFAGGSNSSANILFICELILFTMCMRGKKQKIYIVLTMMSTSFVQRITREWDNPVYPMDMRQYQMGGAVLGVTTSLLIAALLLKQKNEYMKARDSAIETGEALEKSNMLQKNFLANMSHEIRSPLGIVMGFNNLIKESSDVEQIHEYSKDISQAGTTLLTVINDILDYSKIESGKLDIIEDDYSFEAMISEIKKDIGLKCDEKGLKFVTRTDKEIPKALYGDNIRIKQCLLNVLSNAVKYTEQGVIIFNVQCDGITEDGKYKLKYIVKDTGKGISKEAIPNLYSAFQRLDEGMNRGIEGTGLGLAITKNLLDEMKGTIDVESTIGVGTTFTICLEQSKGKETDTKVDVKTENSLKDIRVLVVDDTALNLTLIRKLLEKEGAIVNAIDNGKDCLADVVENTYDIILLDHMMPEMNGVEVFKRMREHGGKNKNTPVVMLTANAMAGALKEYMDIGFDGYLSKPIAPAELNETILRLTNK